MPTDIERKRENLRDALARRPHDHVPLMARISTPVLWYYGLTYPEARRDPDLYRQIICRFFQEMPSDMLAGSGMSAPADYRDLIGDAAQTILCEDGITLQHRQRPLMEGDEYDQAIQDIETFNKEVLLPRRLPLLFDRGPSAAAELLRSILTRRRENLPPIPEAEMTGLLEQRFGQTVFGDPGLYLTTPGDILFDTYRGFKGTLTDLRRHYSKMMEFCDVLWEKGYAPDFSEIPIPDGKLSSYMSHIPCFLSSKQYDDLCFKYFRRQVEAIAAQGSKVYLLAEGSWSHLLDHLLDLPRDSIIFNAENDDICDVAAKIGQHQQLMGGVKLVSVRMRPLEENLDYARRCIDTCAPEYGFYFGTDKAWCCKGDVNDTLFAVYRFAAEYGRYGGDHGTEI